jgi:hypothetical protein
MKVFIERAETEEIDVMKKYARNANTHTPLNIFKTN